jgi:hypothetical protein
VRRQIGKYFLTADYILNLSPIKYFPDLSQTIICMAFACLVHDSTLRNMAFHVAKSMMSVKDMVTYSEKHFSTSLRTIGSMRLEPIIRDSATMLDKLHIHIT